MDEEQVEVELYSGHTYAERPRSFRWRGEEVTVEEVLAAWRTPAGPAFRLRTPRGTFTVAYDEAADCWWLRLVPEQ